jgi:predicted transcriptional regulator
MLAIWHDGSYGRRAVLKDNAEKVTVRLPKALVKAAQHYALDADTSFQAVVAEALAEFLRRHAKEGAR